MGFFAEADSKIISGFRAAMLPLARFGIFTVYFWFGALKIIGKSPASPLVEALFLKTIPFAEFGVFIVLFGLFECLIGALFLIKGLERAAIALFFFHMIATTMPLFLLPEITWNAFLVPTLEGQYIIKNLLLVTAVVLVGAFLEKSKNVKPL